METHNIITTTIVAIITIISHPYCMAATTPENSSRYSASFLEWYNGDGINASTQNDDNTKNTHGIPSSSKRSKRETLRLPLIDLRSDECYSKCHLNTNNHGDDKKNNDIIVNLPFSSLKSGERSCELPPRNVPFCILIPSSSTASEEEEEIKTFFFATRSKSTNQSRKPWLVQQIIMEHATMWDQAKELGILNIPDVIREEEEMQETTQKENKFHPLARLWKPDSMIQYQLLPLLKHKLQEYTKALVVSSSSSSSSLTQSLSSTNHTTFPFCIWDLGSGAGRDVSFLAQELRYHLYYHHHHQQQLQHRNIIQIVGIDHHKGSSKRCIPLWKNHGVQDLTTSLLLDLNKLTLFQHHLHEMNTDSYDGGGGGIVCLYAVRFLNRKLISYIANCQSRGDARKEGEVEKMKSNHQLSQSSPPPTPLILTTGTIFAMSHFCKATKDSSWDFDHPKESHVLERNELRILFKNNDSNWKILYDEICMDDSDHGRTLIHFIAQRI